MCGRYVVTNSVSKTKKIVKKAIFVEDTQNFNAHPYQKLPIIKKYKNGNTLENMKWGIIPKWAKDKNFKSLINARLETIDEKITFKNLIKKFRCIAIADGFYEWKRDNNDKKPFYFTRSDQRPLYIAGIFDGDYFCLITEKANEKITEIHHRQPVILEENDLNDYLNLENSGSEFLNDCAKQDLVFHEVSKEVNKPSNNYENLIKKLTNY